MAKWFEIAHSDYGRDGELFWRITGGGDWRIPRNGTPNMIELKQSRSELLVRVRYANSSGDSASVWRINSGQGCLVTIVPPQPARTGGSSRAPSNPIETEGETVSINCYATATRPVVLERMY